jgi:hypothetical protein
LLVAMVVVLPGGDCTVLYVYAPLPLPPLPGCWCWYCMPGIA